MGEYTEKLAQIRKNTTELVKDAPDIKDFLGYVRSAESTNVLDHKTKELITLAIAVALKCEPCILLHADLCLKAGATKEEILDALKVAVVMAGGPAYMYAAKAYEAVNEYLVGKTDEKQEC